MNRFLALVILSVTALVSVLPAQAQQSRKSPHETISRRTANDNLITIVYGRPYTKDPRTGQPRKIWGGVVPFGKIWRLGADEATLLITQKPLQLAGTEVPAGAYSLYMLPDSEDSAQLLINREIGQWGTDLYQVEKELARIPMKATKLGSAVHQFTIAIDNGSPNGGQLKFSWEQTQFSAPFAVKK